MKRCMKIFTAALSMSLLFGTPAAVRAEEQEKPAAEEVIETDMLAAAEEMDGESENISCLDEENNSYDSGIAVDEALPAEEKTDNEDDTEKERVVENTDEAAETEYENTESASASSEKNFQTAEDDDAFEDKKAEPDVNPENIAHADQEEEKEDTSSVYKEDHKTNEEADTAEHAKKEKRDSTEKTSDKENTENTNPVVHPEEINSAEENFEKQNEQVIRNAWKDSEAGKQYYDNNGHPVSGIVSVNGKKYLFDQNGFLKSVNGWVTYNGKKYYINNGTVKTSSWLKDGTKTYYLDKNGNAVTGWKTINGKKYYFTDKNCRSYKNGTEGIMLTGFKTVNGKRYYFMDKRYKEYTPGAEGSLMKGFKTINGKKYYFFDRRAKAYNNSVKNSVASGFKTIGGKLYHFSPSGIMTTGLFRKTGRIYYFKNSGERKTGWVKNKKGRLYMPKNAKYISGWKTISGKKYYFNKNNSASLNVKVIGKNLYYFGSDGALRKKYSRNASPLMRLKKSSRNKTVSVIGRMLKALEKKDTGRSAILMQYTDITPKEYEMIRSAIGDMYFTYDECPIGGARGYNPSTGSISACMDNIYLYYNTGKVKQRIEEDRRLKAAVEKAVDRMGIRYSSDERKVRAINDYICRNFRYEDHDRTRDFAYCVLSGKGICSNYAFFFNCLCKEAGLESKEVSGYADGGLHAWNAVKVNGRWKYVDPTWNDDGSYSNNSYLLSDWVWGDHELLER